MTTDNRLSIVIAVHDQANEIEQNLERFLTQPCEEGCEVEVIVVDDSSTDNTPDVLTQMKKRYPQLYTTFLPKSVVFNPSRLQLALSVGVKAAKSQWVVLADISRPPLTEDWLKGLQQQAARGGEVMMSYSDKKHNSVYYQTWQTLDDAAPLIRKAERRPGNGHQGKWKKFRRGLYDAVAVRKDCVHDAVRLFDKDFSSYALWKLRWQVWWRNTDNCA